MSERTEDRSHRELFDEESAAKTEPEQRREESPVGSPYAPWQARLIVLVVIGSVVLSVYCSFFGNFIDQELKIIAHLERSGESEVSGETPVYALRGRVFRSYNGAPVEGASVWAVVRDEEDNEKSYLSERTDEGGAFQIEGIRRFVDGHQLVLATIRATDPEAKPKNGFGVADGAFETVGFPGFAPPRRRTVHISSKRLVALPTIFLLSLLVPFVLRPGRLRHHLSLFLAVAFTLVMTLHLSLALLFVHSEAQQGEILTFGVASIFYGTYAEGVASDWLVSLTSVASGAETLSGFGAPLWVVLLSVLGAGVLTVSLVVHEISDRPTYGSSPSELRTLRIREEQIVQHQFFICFAPVGAMFVYQLLAAAGAVSQPATVAIAALGAGASLNYLLVAAMEKVQGLLKTDQARDGRRGAAGKDAEAAMFAA